MMAYPRITKLITELKGIMGKPANVAERRLNDKDSANYDKYTPSNWFQKLPIVPEQETPPASGYGYTQSPYVSQWSKMWGVAPITDLPKYRMMYRTVPIVKKAIDKTVATAISKGFKLELDPDVDNREEILEYLQSWINQQQNFKLTLQMIASDALTYGNAYAEVVYTGSTMEEKYSNDNEFHRVTIPDPNEDYKMGGDGVPYLPTVNYNGNGRYLEIASEGNPVWIKPLDPLWMRVRRDSYGNVFGYLQYLSTPPVAFTTSKIIHVRFNPKSWWTENAYGTSMLLSLVRTQEAIWTIENDLILISHACAKPPLVFSCGTDEDPWTESQLTAFVASTSARGPGGDIYHRGDVGATPLPFPASSLAPLIAHLDIHMQQRMISLGVPPDLLGIHGGSNRSTAMVTFDDWINTIQLLQQQLGDALQEQLFRSIIEGVFGEGTPIPRMVWNQVYEKDDSAEVQKTISLRTANIITTNEARAMLGESGHNLEPVTSGDSLLPPAAFMPPEGSVDKEDGPKMPPEDAILEDDSTPMKAEEEEFSDIKIKEPYVFMPKKEKYLEMEQPNIAGDSFAESGTPSGNGQAQKPDHRPAELIYPLLKKKKASVEAEIGKSTGQSNDLSDYPIKDLRNVKIKKLAEQNDITVWLIDSKLAAKRYDPKWDGDGEKWIGSHHLVFPYVPDKEIWVSDQVLPEEREKVIIHEYTEYLAMGDGMTYAEAHLKALKAEGNLSELELRKRSYITPEEVIEKLNSTYSKNTDGTWQMGDHIIKYDQVGGIIYVHEGEKVIDQLLVRSMGDMEKLITKLDNQFRNKE